MNLSKTKYCQGVQCKKILWLSKYKPELKEIIDNQAVFDNGTKVGELAKQLFGSYIDIPYSDNLNEMILDTKKALENEEAIITEASFNYNHNFCSVDILKKVKDEYEVYEVKSSTEVHDIYLDDVSYQVYVLRSLGLNVKKASIVHLNIHYERIGELELNKLFTIEDVTDIANNKQKEIPKIIEEINECVSNTIEPYMDIDTYCQKPYECSFYKYCSRHLPEFNVFNIRQMQSNTKFKLYHKGIIAYKELLNSNINDKYKQQIEYELYDKEDFIDIYKIKEFLKDFTYPLYFLDFETYQQPIPEFDHVRPFMQIPFQYSLHYYESENSELKHEEFLAEASIDPRRSLAEKLVKDIPINTCVLAYNMQFEKMVIKNLASLYPDLSNHLMNIHDNMLDLMVPFKNRWYYTKDMHGSYSIKYVLPALFPRDPELNYHNLEDIHNGSEAMNSFQTLSNYSYEKQQQIRSNLLKYCYLDTYAMVKIYLKLLEVTK